MFGLIQRADLEKHRQQQLQRDLAGIEMILPRCLFAQPVEVVRQHVGVFVRQQEDRIVEHIRVERDDRLRNALQKVGRKSRGAQAQIVASLRYVDDRAGKQHDQVVFDDLVDFQVDRNAASAAGAQHERSSPEPDGAVERFQPVPSVVRDGEIGCHVPSALVPGELGDADCGKRCFFCHRGNFC